MGLHVSGREHLQGEGSRIIVANHNSHLDTLILMSLFSVSEIKGIRPVAAADYFFKNKALKWFALNIIGIIPITRKTKISNKHPLQGAMEALDRGESIIVFPEGSRGEAEQLGAFKSGVAHLAKSYPHIRVIPINIYGAGKALPRGEALLVPFIADVSISEPMFFGENSIASFTEELEKKIKRLQMKNEIKTKEEL
ncbi:1-acyl-sn-glycerol-3-phosphate acyltransferase [bacterium]|nr:1-acyl-sn-glycerol-3-phosphate acyltransferase [bacterium]MBU1884896.1 1-acyl-sn-glycerol-3-phosphate acyltransferase [bacterium]